MSPYAPIPRVNTWSYNRAVFAFWGISVTGCSFAGRNFSPESPFINISTLADWLIWFTLAGVFYRIWL
jgi:hypothetical protein